MRPTMVLGSYQCQGVLLIRKTAGCELTELAGGAYEGGFDIFLSSIIFSFFLLGVIVCGQAIVLGNIQCWEEPRSSVG